MSWTYDFLGRVSSKSQTIKGVTKSVGYTYTSEFDPGVLPTWLIG
jgi:hypothetical protein